MIEQYTSPAVVNNSQEPWLVGEGVSLSGSIAIPSLDFNFVTNAFPGTVTFSRASSATMFDSSGTLVYAPMNAIRNSSASGAVAGTPGTLPTNWQITGGGIGTLTREVVGTGVVNGITYIDLRISGITSTTGLNYAFEPTIGSPVSSSGQTWTSSVYVALVGGSISNINQISGAAAIGRTSGGAGTIDTFTSGDNKAALTSTLQRFSATGTLVDAATASLQPYTRVTFSAGVAIDITLRIGLPQLELGSVARTAVATSGTAYQGPRLDYDPATLLPRGFLVEEQRTNLLLQSEDLSTTWSLGDGTVTANSWTAPTGAMTGDIYTVGTNSTFPGQNVTVVNSTTYTLSFYYDKTLTTAAFFRLRFSINGGSVSAWFDTASATFGALNAQLSGGAAVDVGNNIYRVSLQIAYGASDGGSRSVAIAGVTANSGTTADTGNDLAIWGAQLEAGAFPTSYISTTTTALTRSADVAAVDTLSPWFNGTEGTLYAEAVFGALENFKQIVNFNNATSSELIALQTGTAPASRASVVDGGVGQATLSPGNLTVDTGFKISLAYKENDFAAVLNGGTVQSDVAGTLPTVTKMSLGALSAFSGISLVWIRRITYYPRRLSNAELQAITA